MYIVVNLLGFVPFRLTSIVLDTVFVLMIVIDFLPASFEVAGPETLHAFGTKYFLRGIIEMMTIDKDASGTSNGVSGVRVCVLNS